MPVKPTLGRGLSELLSSVKTAPLSTDVLNERRFLPVDLLHPGKYQPRRDFDSDALQELADSISTHGILQPLLVRPSSKNNYEIIGGERRWRAAQLAGLQQVPVFIRDIPDEAAVAMSLIENIQREDLNVMEQAIALKRLGDEFNLTHEAIASAVGKSRVTISNLLRLLQLASPVKTLLEKGELEMGHARALLSLDETKQIQFANTIATRKLSVRETENLVRKQSGDTTTHNKAKSTHVDPDIARLQGELSDKLGASVMIEHLPTGKGKLVIKYHSVDELEGILAQIG